MKKSLLAAAAAMMLSTVAASAADMAVKARPYVSAGRLELDRFLHRWPRRRRLGNH